MTSLKRIRINSRLRDMEERREAERKRAMLVLVLDYLERNGYVRALQTLQSEGGVAKKGFDVTDNIDLDVVVRGFEDYFVMKFGRRPKLFREKSPGASSSFSRSRRTTGGVAGVGTSAAKKALMRAASTSSAASAAAAGSGSSVGSEASSSRQTRGRRRRRERGRGRGRGGQRTRDASSSSTASSSATSSGGGASSASEKSSSSASAVTTQGGESDATSSESDLDFFSVGRYQPATKAPGRARHHPRYGGSPEAEEGEGEEVGPRRGKRRLVAEGAGIEEEGGVPSHDEEIEDYFSQRLMKPLTNAFTGEYRDYAESIRRDIIVQNPLLYWSDIVGLEKAKQLTTEAVVLPMKYPSFFTGVLRPWTGILLFGPPGTGKTMLAKAVATETKTTFFNISASTIVSKWRGDSEKLVRVLFEMARFYSPSTIFIDEVDAILSQRRGHEHEASRRMKTELMIQMDGVRSQKSDADARVFILAASNLPWDLDQAVLRRLEKRILVGLPCVEARETIFRKSLGDRCCEGVDFHELGVRTEGFSGADIVTVCKEGLMRPVRRILSRLETMDEMRSSQEFLDHEIDPAKVRVAMEDLLQAIEVTKPSGNQYEEKYDEWNREHGAHL